MACANEGPWWAFWEVGGQYVDILHESAVRSAGGSMRVLQSYRRDAAVVKAADTINTYGTLGAQGRPSGGRSTDRYLKDLLEEWIPRQAANVLDA